MFWTLRQACCQNQIPTRKPAIKPIRPPLTAQAAMPIKTPDRLSHGSDSYNNASTDHLT